ncbi:MAG: hypothetical protein WCA13_11740 [Terriglobales bacterium]
MNSLALESVRAKIDRAQHHLDAVKTALKLVLGSESKTQSVAFKIDPERQQLITTIPKAPPIDPALPLMIGDCVHNLRSALDHLVYQLALQNGASSKAAEKTFFPIYLTETEFDDRVKKLVKPFISDSAFTELQQSQPYAAYDIPEEADIWILHKLDIIDKHRLLIVAGQQFAVTQFTLTFPNRAPWHEVISEPKWKPMEDGAEIIRFEIPGAFYAPGKVRVQIDAIKTVEFINTGLRCDGVMVETALNQFMGIVSATIRDFGVKFFGE